MELKGDNFVLRHIEGKSNGGKYKTLRKKVISPLTKKEKEQLEKEAAVDCKNVFLSYFLKAGVLSDCESPEDLSQDSYLFMLHVMKNFDKAKCGPIGKEDIKGKNSPKTLKWYFINYFSQRCKYKIKDIFKDKNAQGAQIETGYVTETIEHDSIYNEEYISEDKRISLIQKEIENASEDVKLFFKQRFVFGFTFEELRELWGDKYIQVREEFNSLKKHIRQEVSRAS